MKVHTCPTCTGVRNLPELNDQEQVDPKIKLDELVKIEGHGPAIFRVMKISGMTLELEMI